MGIVIKTVLEGIQCDYCQKLMKANVSTTADELVLSSLQNGWTVHGDYTDNTHKWCRITCDEAPCMVAFCTEMLHERKWHYTEFPGPKLEAK